MTPRRKTKAVLDGQREALEAALNGMPLEASLGVLVRTATDQLGEGVRAAFYLANAEGTALHHVVGMPAEYAAAVDGFEIGPDALACGLATHSGQPVLTTDVMEDPLWAPWRSMAERFDYRGCWSVPIHTRKGEFVGTFALYWREPRKATSRDLEFIRPLTQAAAVIIARHTEEELRKRAEAALRESEARLSKVLDIDTVGVVFFDLAGGIQDANDAFLAMIGYSRAELTSGEIRYENLTPPGWRWRDEQTLAELETGGKAGPFEKEYTHKDGSRIWILCAAKLLDPHTAVEFVIDVTARRRAEAALHESEERLALAFATLPVGIAIIDAGGATIMTNDVMRRFLPTGTVHSRDRKRMARWKGWDADGRPVRPENFPAERALRGETVSPGLQLRYRGGDGREIWTEVLSAPLRDSTGRVTGALVVVVDIDWLKRSEQVARESEERFRQFAEASSDVLWIRNSKTLDWEYLSPAFELIYGMRVEDALAGKGLRNWTDLIVEDDRARAHKAINRVRAGESVSFEYRVRRPDGELRWLRDTDFPMRGPSGAVERIGGIGQDITKEKAAANRMEVMVAELQHRTRNLIAVVRSIAGQTMAVTGPTDAFRDEFNDRLEALARVQGLLSRSDEEPVTIEGLIRMELDALGAGDRAGGRIVLDGPDVRLRNSIVQTLALALHELATNARKHGALSTENGRLGVTWQVREADGRGRRLELNWVETGAELPIHASPDRGYGRELIERALPYALGAKTTYELRTEGARCTIDLPLGRER